jgi:VWFA-related protein
VSVSLASGLLFAALAVTAQEPPGPAPGGQAAPPLVFGVGVDVVAVDASVVGPDGRPELGLGAGDFEVRVDGQPRRVVSAEYLGRDLEPEAGPSPAVAHFSSNEHAARGRLVLLLVDRGNIGQGHGREVLKAADLFLANLAPADRAALSFVPGPGQSIEFSADRDAVRRGLKSVVGQAQRGGYKVPLGEAIALAEGHDSLRWTQFVELTCQAYVIPEQVADCGRQLEADAAQVYLNYRERSLATQRALATTFDALKRVEGPKTVVLVTEGLGTQSEDEVRDLAALASEAQVTLYVVLLNTQGTWIDAGVGGVNPSMALNEDRERETRGLFALAGLSRGLVLNAVANPDNAFQRIGRELMGYYLLGFEPEAGDRDGKAHEVKVSATRPGASVRSRRLLSIPSTPPSHEAMLAAALRSPLVDRGLPLRATAYVMAAAPGQARLLIAADVGRARRPLSVAFAVSTAAGKVVASRAYQGIAGGPGERVEFVGEAVVEAGGAYTLRLAVVDADGRRGSVEHPLKAAPVAAGGLEVSDLVLAASGAGGGLRPAVDLEIAGGGLSALVEIGGRDKDKVSRAEVALELADSADGPVLLRVPVTLGAPRADGAREATISVAAGLLPPGAYSARAEVSLDGKPLAAVARPFRIAAARGAAAAASPLAALLAEPRPFDRSLLLGAGPLARFADRVLEIVPGPLPPGLAPALAEVRAGRPEAAADALAAPGRDDARTSFVRGVSLHARGQHAAALTQLQVALRESSELFPAAVYMGACYAALGRDLDAIGAWQTALVGEAGGSSAVYALLADALTRVKEPQQAVEILGEGLASFPDDASLRRRLALALAAAGRREEALPLLTAWVEEHPGDDEALLTTLAVLFDGFSREAAGAADGAERARLVRFARAYVDGKGPNREVIGRWLRYLTDGPGS